MTCWTKQSGGEKWDEEKKREKKGEEEKRSERLQLLSRIFSNQTFGFRRSKKESSSTRRELHMGTRIRGFRQTPRGRGSSHTRFIFSLRAIQMAWDFWGH